MSSNIYIQKFCEHCGNEFTARTTTTRYCGDTCSKRAYKARGKAIKVNAVIEDTEKKRNKKPIEDLSTKEFLTVKEVSTLLNCSVRSVYNYIKSGVIPATNLGDRLTRIKRSNINDLFTEPEPHKPQPKDYDISDCYTIGEVLKLFNVSQTAFQNIVKREEIPKFQKGKFVYVPKEIVNNILNAK